MGSDPDQQNDAVGSGGGAAPEGAVAEVISWRQSWWFRWSMYLLAVGMLVGAVWFAVVGTSGEEGGPSGFDRLAEADPLDLIGIGVLTLSGVLLNGVVFWLIAKPFETGRAVGLGEMIGLIGASSLLNYLPMRAGMVGRAAYLKRRHGISLTASLSMLIMVGGGTAYIYFLLALVTLWRGGIDGVWWLVTIGLLSVGALAAVPIARLTVRLTPGVDTPRFTEAGAAVWLGAAALVTLRSIDVALAAGRLYLAARVLGEPIEVGTTVVLASGGMFMKQATPLPGGIGVVELFYGLCGKLGISTEGVFDARLGTALGLVDRAVEAVVFIIVGLVSLWLLRKRWHDKEAELTDPSVLE